MVKETPIMIERPERKQTSRSSRKSERVNKTVNAKLNDQKLLR